MPEELARAIRGRCSCPSRNPTLPPLAGHDPCCSLQNTGWLS